MRRIDARRGTENFRALFPTEFELLAKNQQGGPFGPPLIRSRVNIDKTTCMTIETLHEHELISKFNLKFVNEIKILGILMDRDAKNVTDKNLQLKMPMIKTEIEQWKRRCLTPIGRISIVKALLLSKLVHIFIALPNPSPRYTKELERLLFEFVSGQKKDKVIRTTLAQKHSKDGLSMVNVESFIKSLKLSWFKRLCTSNAEWTIIAAQEISNVWTLLTYGCKKLKSTRCKVTNPFYVDFIDALSQFTDEYNLTEGDIVTERIGFSDWTKYKTTMVKQWDNKVLCKLFSINLLKVHRRFI